MLDTLAIATACGLATGLGVVPFFFRKTIPRALYDTILGMGAGLMISAATLGLLHEALETVHDGGGWPALCMVCAGFTIGLVIMFAMDQLIPHQHAGGHGEHIGHAHAGHGTDRFHPHEDEHKETVRQGLLVSGAMTIHRMPEGFAIGTAFAAGSAGAHALGTLLVVAVTFQNICEGAVMGAPLRYGGWSRRKTFAVVTATGLATPVAALVGLLAGTYASSTLPLTLSLAAGALIYLIFNEIIPETHSHGNEKLATIGLLTGFLVTMIVRSMGH